MTDDQELWVVNSIEKTGFTMIQTSHTVIPSIIKYMIKFCLRYTY